MLAGTSEEAFATTIAYRASLTILTPDLDLRHAGDS